MYNPTNFEQKKQKQHIAHRCLNCGIKFYDVHTSGSYFCSKKCQEEYDELGAYEQVDTLTHEDTTMYFPE